MGPSFMGEFSQKVDGKGRMSIPADFRHVLEEGDPLHPGNPNPRLVLLYGPHLKNHLQVYTITAMDGIKEGIQKLQPGSKHRHRASRLILSKAWKTEADRDGRIVLPKARREQIGLGEEGGETMLVAMGEYFELWNKETYEREVTAEMDAFLAEQDDDFDPMSFLGNV